MEDQNQERTVVQNNGDDPSSLLPNMTFVVSKKMKIVIAVFLLVGTLTGVHFAMKDPVDAPQAPSETQGNGVITVIPQSTSTPAVIPEIVKDKDGKEYLTGELIVAFRASVPVEEAKAMVVAQGGVVKQHFTQFPVFLVGITDPGSEGVNRAILRFQTLQAVERAEPNYLTQAPTP